jgi:hypothetical protein
MNADALDMLIEKLEAIMPAAPDPLGLSVVLHDWRPVWNLAKEIQEAFNSGIRYPTKELRQRAWLRFNALRDEAPRRALASAPICDARLGPVPSRVLASLRALPRQTAGSGPEHRRRS